MFIVFLLRLVVDDFFFFGKRVTPHRLEKKLLHREGGDPPRPRDRS